MKTPRLRAPGITTSVARVWSNFHRIVYIHVILVLLTPMNIFQFPLLPFLVVPSLVAKSVPSFYPCLPPTAFSINRVFKSRHPFICPSFFHIKFLPFLSKVNSSSPKLSPHHGFVYSQGHGRCHGDIRCYGSHARSVVSSHILLPI